MPTRERLEATLEAAFAMAASRRWCCRLTVTSRKETTHSGRPGTWLSRYANSRRTPGAGCQVTVDSPPRVAVGSLPGGGNGDGAPATPPGRSPHSATAAGFASTKRASASMTASPSGACSTSSAGSVPATGEG